jgi:hypothetical protein
MGSMTIEQTPQGPQLTIRGLVAALDGLPGGVLIKMTGFGQRVAIRLAKDSQQAKLMACFAWTSRFNATTASFPSVTVKQRRGRQVWGVHR